MERSVRDLDALFVSSSETLDQWFSTGSRGHPFLVRQHLNYYTGHNLHFILFVGLHLPEVENLCSRVGTTNSNLSTVRGNKPLHSIEKLEKLIFNYFYYFHVTESDHYSYSYSFILADHMGPLKWVFETPALLEALKRQV